MSEQWTDTQVDESPVETADTVDADDSSAEAVTSDEAVVEAVAQEVDEAVAAQDVPDDAVLDDAVAEDVPEAVAAEEAAEDDDVDPAEAFKAELRRAPGEWFVIHSYAGYENRVKANLETRIVSLNMEDYIYQVEVTMEEVTAACRSSARNRSGVSSPIT